MAKILFKSFDYSNQRNSAYQYHSDLINQVTQLGYDKNIVKQEVDYEYRCSHKYADSIEIYIETDDEAIISALKIIQ